MNPRRPASVRPSFDAPATASIKGELYLDIDRQAGGKCYAVRAVNEQGVAGYWSDAATAVSYPPPAAPDGLTATAASSVSLDVSWNAPASVGGVITGYDVRYRESGAGSWSHHAHYGTATSATIGGLTPGTTYEVQVRARDAAGGGAWSASAFATTPVVPGAPGSLSVTGFEHATTLSVSWAAPGDTGASPVTGYDVQYRLKLGDDRNWYDHPHSGLGTTTSITGLEQRRTYEVRVRARNSHGAGPWSAPVSEMTGQPRPELAVTVSTQKLEITEGETAAYQVVLNQEPNGTVTVRPTSDDTGAVTVSPGSLTFNSGNWSTARTVTVTAVADNDFLDELRYIANRVSGGGLTAAPYVVVTVHDTDEPPAGDPTTDPEPGVDCRPSNRDPEPGKAPYSYPFTNECYHPERHYQGYRSVGPPINRQMLFGADGLSVYLVDEVGDTINHPSDLMTAGWTGDIVIEWQGLRKPWRSSSCTNATATGGSLVWERVDREGGGVQRAIYREGVPLPSNGSVTFTGVQPGHYELKNALEHPTCGTVVKVMPVWVLDNSYPAWAHAADGDYVVLGDN